MLPTSTGVPKSRTRLKQLSTHALTLPSHNTFILFQIAAAACSVFFFFFLVKMLRGYLILKVKEAALVGNRVSTGRGALGSMSSGPELSPEQSRIRIQPPLRPENLGSLVAVQGGWGQPEHESRLGRSDPPPCSPWTRWTRRGSLKPPSPGPSSRGSGWSTGPAFTL